MDRQSESQSSSNQSSSNQSSGLQYYDQFYSSGRRSRRGFVAIPASPNSSMKNDGGYEKRRHREDNIPQTRRYLSLSLEEDDENGVSYNNDVYDEHRDGCKAILTNNDEHSCQNRISTSLNETNNSINTNDRDLSPEFRQNGNMTGVNLLRGLVERLGVPRRRYSRVSATEGRSECPAEDIPSPVPCWTTKLTSSDVELAPLSPSSLGSDSAPLAGLQQFRTSIRAPNIGSDDVRPLHQNYRYRIDEHPTMLMTSDEDCLPLEEEEQQFSSQQPIAPNSTPSTSSIFSRGTIPWVFNYFTSRFIGTRLGNAAVTQGTQTNILPHESFEPPLPSTIGHSFDTTDDAISLPSLTPPLSSETSPLPPLRERFSNFWSNVRTRTSSFVDRVQQRFNDSVTPNSAQSNPDDDPTHQQLILFAGMFVGPLLFALGGFLFFMTPREHIKTRRWGLLNLLMTLTSVFLVLMYSYNEPSIILSERIETYGPLDHRGTPSDLIVSEFYSTGIIKVKSNNPDNPWIKVSRLSWDFSDGNSVSGWGPATLPPVIETSQQHRRLDESSSTTIKRLSYGRVILGKDTNWNNMAEVPEMNTTSGWVLGPSIGQYPVSYNTIAITNLSQISDGIIWSEPIRLMGRILVEFDFSWGSSPSASSLKSIYGKNSTTAIINDLPPSLGRFHLGQTNQYNVILNDHQLPPDFRGAGIRCVPRVSKIHPESTVVPITVDQAHHFGSPFSLWSLVWRSSTGFNKQIVRQIVTLPQGQIAAPSKISMRPSPNPSDPNLPVSSILSNEDRNLTIDPTLQWICRVALIDTTTAASIPTSISSSSINTNWISLNSVFLRALP